MIQESFVTKEDEEPEYYTLSLSPSPSPFRPRSKRSGDDDSRLARNKSQSSTPKNMNLVQQSDKEEVEEPISKKGNYIT